MNFRRIDNIETGVFDIYCKRNILCDYQRKSTSFFIAESTDGHSMTDQSVGTIEIFNDLHSGAVASDTQSHQALKDIFSIFGGVAGLHGTAPRAIIEIL